MRSGERSREGKGDILALIYFGDNERFHGKQPVNNEKRNPHILGLVSLE